MTGPSATRWEAQPCYCDWIETSSGTVKLPNECPKHGPFDCAEDLAIYQAAHSGSAEPSGREAPE